MNICIESQLLNHPRRSGLLTYTEGLVYGMSRVDEDNDYTLAFYSLRRKPEEMPGPEDKNFGKVVLKVPDRKFWKRQCLIDNFSLPSLFKRNKIDVFHRTSGYSMPKGNGVFKILTVHDLRTITIGDQYSAQSIEDYKKAVSAADLLVVVSECTKRDLVEYLNVDENKIKVVYLGADQRYRKVSDEKIESVKDKFNIKAPYILSVGSVPRKNIERIIKGFAGSRHSKDHTLVLSCRNDIEKYKAQCEELGIKDSAVFINNMDDEDLVALYNGCCFFLFPSLYEGFGLPILEAMNCGAPVITSKTSACPEVAGDAAIFIDPENVDEISDAVNQLCESSDLRAALTEKGNERIKLFSWDKFAAEMKAIYSNHGH